MHKRSFVAGILTGALLVILAVLAVPGLGPARAGGSAGERAPRTKVVVVTEEIALPPAPAPEPPPVASRAEEPAPEPGAVDDAAAAEAMRDKARRSSHEIAAIATLRNVISAQAQFQACARAEENQN